MRDTRGGSAIAPAGAATTANSSRRPPSEPKNQRSVYNFIFKSMIFVFLGFVVCIIMILRFMGFAVWCFNGRC